MSEEKTELAALKAENEKLKDFAACVSLELIGFKVDNRDNEVFKAIRHNIMNVINSPSWMELIGNMIRAMHDYIRCKNSRSGSDNSQVPLDILKESFYELT